MTQIRSVSRNWMHKNCLVIFEISNIANKKQGKARKQELSKALSSPFKGDAVYFQKPGEDSDGIWEWPSGMTSGCYQVHKSWPQPQPKMAN